MQRVGMKKIFIIIIILTNSLSYGMEIERISFGFGTAQLFKDVPELQEFIVNNLEDPLTFGKTNKTNHRFVKELGWRNLRTVYNNQNPHFLLHHYVPILLVDIGGVHSGPCFENDHPIEQLKERGRNYVAVVNPYERNFYAGHDGLYLDNKITQRGEKIIQLHIDQRKIQYPKQAVRYCGYIANGQPLTTLVLCEDQKKAAQMIHNDAYFKGGYLDDNMDLLDPIFHNNLYWRYIMTLLTAMSYAGDTNLFELLLMAEKDNKTKYAIDNLGVCKGTLTFYSLLSYAQNIGNKKAFQALVNIDPYGSVNSVKVFRKNRMLKTMLDVMIDSGKFDLENIAYFKKSGGRTAEELKKQDNKCVIS